MSGIVRDRFRFFALLVALAAVLAVTPVLLAQDGGGNIRCKDQLVNSIEECLALMAQDGDGNDGGRRRRRRNDDGRRRRR